MAFMSFGYRLSSEASPFVEMLDDVPKGVSKVIFAGWASFVFENEQGQIKICGEASDAEKELLRLWSLGNINNQVDRQSTSESSVRSKLYGWDALQGYLSPDGHVIALCLDSSIATDSLYTPRQVYPTALDVASCGPSTDCCTVVVDGQTGELYHWTLSNPVPRAVQPLSSQLDSTKSQDSHSRRTKFVRVWAGEAHFLALDQDGTLHSWGSGRHGQLGHGDLVSKLFPEPIEALEGIRIADAACGASFSVALSETGDVYTFGLNDHGQLGIGNAAVSQRKLGQGEGQQQGQERCNTALPQLVDFFEDSSHCEQGKSYPIELTVVQVACGHSHTVVLDDEGRVWSCGWGKYGQLGQDESVLQDRSGSGQGSKNAMEFKQKMLRSKGSLAIGEDRYLFGEVTVGGMRRWAGVCCGRWSTFVWSEGRGGRRSGADADKGDKNDG
ncbi:MAG: regulator of chromosome condensation 1/beta-lactamase-inhibitor protein II [Linnemannia gamsii]|nr:MAG: regulator of chromosome condensation 1/beta-lactamase-inhibitor protein II [Linnemannia gamsii]